ncbi:MAG: hypothetical protein ACE5NM_04895 [Sedimentisphaerales bacterium]
MAIMQNLEDNHRFAVRQGVPQTRKIAFGGGRDLQWHPAPIEPRTLFHLTLWLELCLQDNWCGAGFSSIGPEAWRKADLGPIKWKFFLTERRLFWYK